MTSISSLASISSAAQLSINQLLLGPVDQSQTENSDSLFGSSYSLNLSDDALSALSGDSSSDDSAGNILSALTYSNYSGTSQGNIAALPGSGGDTDYQYSAGPMVPTSTSGASFEEAEMADGGPLPAFLAYVDQAMNLNSQQVQSLDDIATEYQNAPGSQATVNSIAAALQQAGIPETI